MGLPGWLRVLISIHALLAESDCYSLRYSAPRWYFYPRSPCGERRHWIGFPLVGRAISIHALLAESDLTSVVSSTGTTDFYPRSPCGERRVHYDNYNLHCVISIHALLAESDFRLFFIVLDLFRFLSTLSLRRATYDGLIASANFCNFYPRSPCGERRVSWLPGRRC